MTETKPKIKIPLPVVVEGKYDKMRLTSVIDAHIITTEGFGVFNSAEKRTLIKRLAENGIIILTDSDRGGRQIRSYLTGILPEGSVYSLHIPKIEGKERRKRRPSAAGTLGVEGMEEELLRDIFLKFSERMGFSPDGDAPADGDGTPQRGGITKADLFAAGLTGGKCSGEARDRICQMIGLPTGMNAAAFMGAVNLLLTPDEFYGLTATDSHTENGDSHEEN